MLHIDAMFVYLLGFILFRFLLTLGHAQFPDVLGYATDIHVQQLLDATNATREKAGVAPLTLDQRLSRAAALKAQDMFAKGYWAHNSPEGNTPWEFVTAAGYRYRVAGENLAKNFSVSNAVVDAWMASPTHRDNIMRVDYKDIGFAVVNGVLGGEETTLVVQMFGAGDSQLAYQIKPTILTPSAPATAPPVLASLPPPTLGISDVLIKPIVDISKVSKQVTMAFSGLILFVVVLDGWFVYRKKIIRVAGHSGGHVVFLAIVLMFLHVAVRGNIL